MSPSLPLVLWCFYLCLRRFAVPKLIIISSLCGECILLAALLGTPRSDPKHVPRLTPPVTTPNTARICPNRRVANPPILSETIMFWLLKIGP